MDLAKIWQSILIQITLIKTRCSSIVKVVKFFLSKPDKITINKTINEFNIDVLPYLPKFGWPSLYYMGETKLNGTAEKVLLLSHWFMVFSFTFLMILDEDNQKFKMYFGDGFQYLSKRKKFLIVPWYLGGIFLVLTTTHLIFIRKRAYYLWMNMFYNLRNGVIHEYIGRKNAMTLKKLVLFGLIVIKVNSIWFGFCISFVPFVPVFFKWNSVQILFIGFPWFVLRLIWAYSYMLEFFWLIFFFSILCFYHKMRLTYLNRELADLYLNEYKLILKPDAKNRIESILEHVHISMKEVEISNKFWKFLSFSYFTLCFLLLIFMLHEFLFSYLDFITFVFFGTAVCTLASINYCIMNFAAGINTQVSD